MKFISCISLALLSFVSAQACEHHNNQIDDKEGLSNQHQANPITQWLTQAKLTLERNDVHEVKYSGDNLWLYTPQQVPFAIFKPLNQEIRCNDNQHSWRKKRNLYNETACVALVRCLKLSNLTPINCPIPYGKFNIFLNGREPLVGLLETPIKLISVGCAIQNTHLSHFGNFLLNLESKYLHVPIHTLSLADLNDFIDADFGERREKVIDDEVQRLKIKGSEDFHYNHYQFFLGHINHESLFRAAVLDMFLFHRDMKPDNVLLHITESGIHFILTDFEYAMHPFRLPVDKEENGDEKEPKDLRNTYLPLEKITRVNYLPFYLDFPQSYQALHPSFFKFITELDLQKIENFFTSPITQFLHPNGLEDFNKRFNWLYQVAQDIVSEKRPTLSLRQLHKEFKHTFGLKGKFYKDSRHRVKERYFYTPYQFALLNPKRPPCHQEKPEDLDLAAFERQLIEKIDDTTQSDHASDHSIHDGYERKL